MPHFNRDLFAFLSELNRHNTREWFLKNKARYESAVKEPLRLFVGVASERLRKISREFEAGSVFRINRDTRFSKAAAHGEPKPVLGTLTRGWDGARTFTTERSQRCLRRRSLR